MHKCRSVCLRAKYQKQVRTNFDDIFKENAYVIWKKRLHLAENPYSFVDPVSFIFYLWDSLPLADST